MSPTETPLTVLQLCSLSGRHGTAHLAGRLCSLLGEAGHRVVLGAREGSKLLKWTRDEAVESLAGLHFRRGLRPGKFVGDVRRIRAFVQREAVDVVHAWQSIDTWIGAAAVKGTGVPLVLSRTVVKPVRMHLGKGWLLDGTSAVLATCRRIEEELARAGYPRERVHPLVEGVDLERYGPRADRDETRAELGVGPAQVVAVNVGRLAAVKGQVFFLRALARLPDHVVGWIAGDGVLRSELEAEVGRLGLERRVRLLGVRDDVPRLLGAADVYVLSSIGSEGSSRATLEAMASGLPVVTTDVGMLPDIVTTADNGYLVPARDDAALGRALGELAASPALRRELGARSRRRAEDERSERAMLDSVLAVYGRIVKVHRPS